MTRSTIAPVRSPIHVSLLRRACGLLGAVALAAAPAAAQSLDRAVPEAAEPGDLVILRGSGLQSTTSVQFTAQVGGFVGTWTIGVAPLSVSATEVRVLVPLFNSFTPPDATPPGDPFGVVRLVPPAGELDFFYMEATFGDLTTPGTGTTQTTGQGKPVVSFALAGGAPAPGNPNFTMLLENAAPGSVALLGIGKPSALPPIPIGDGTLILDLSTAILVGNFVVGPSGDVKLPLPVPPTAHGTFVLQWGLVEIPSLSIAVSNALAVEL